MVPVLVHLIKEIHAELMRGVCGGNSHLANCEPASTGSSPGCTLSEAICVHCTHEEPQALAELERFFHAQDDMSVLIHVGLAHGQFETIHPFLEDNGRIGRLLITFLLVEKWLLRTPVLY